MAKSKDYDMTYNAEHYTVAANDIIKGKQSMTLQTARLIRLLITQVVKEDKDLKTYSCRIIDLAKFLNIDSSNLYKHIRTICDCAMKSVVYIGTDNPKQPWEMSIGFQAKIWRRGDNYTSSIRRNQTVCVGIGKVVYTIPVKKHIRILKLLRYSTVWTSEM